MSERPELDRIYKLFSSGQVSRHTGLDLGTFTNLRLTQGMLCLRYVKRAINRLPGRWR
jgi:hypothetical protein